MYLSFMRAENCVRFIPLQNGINQNFVKRHINMHSCTHMHVYTHLPAHSHAYTYMPAQLHIKAIQLQLLMENDYNYHEMHFPNLYVTYIHIM